MSTTPLDPDRAAAMAALTKAGRAMSDALVLFHSRASESVGLGTTDWKALGFIAQAGTITHGELRAELGLKPASVTNILDRLQERNWINRTRSSQDGRSVLISVREDRVSEMRQQIFGPLMRRMEDVYSRYSAKELALLADAFERIAEAQTAAVEDLKDPSDDG